jgi:phosphoserine phosphatase
MKETFEVAGPLTKGLSLRKAIEHARSEMRFLESFEEFISTLYEKGKYFVVNSTGYSVTTEVIKTMYGSEKVYAVICNRLIFGWEGNSARPIEEGYLSHLVKNYFIGGKKEKIYDEILTTGEVELGIRDEKEKARLIFKIADTMGIPRTAIAHIGDTMGDSAGIYEVAKNGGLGIAFNYNEALKSYLEEVLKNEKILGRIILTEPKSKAPNLKSLLDILIPNS